MNLYNATSHDQSKLSGRYNELGVSFVSYQPMILPVGADFESQVKEGIRVAGMIPEKANVLIGGAQIIVEVLLIELGKKNCRFFTAVTKRKSDSMGNFVFELEKVEETYFSRELSKGRINIKDSAV